MRFSDRLRSLELFLRRLLTWNMLLRIYCPWVGDFDLKNHVQTVALARYMLERGNDVEN